MEPTAVPSQARAGAVRAAKVAGITGAGLGLASVAGSVSAGTYFARVLLTPERDRPQEQVIVALDPQDAPEPRTITLVADDETVVPGRYGLWFDHGAGHLRLGDIVGRGSGGPHDPPTVTRVLEGIDAGVPRPGPARWDGYVFTGDPGGALDLPTRQVAVPSEIGDLPAWLVPGADAAPAAPGRWAILVHGRGATRHECLRAVPLLHRLGITALVPTYRNDVEGPASADGLYNLGLSEWRDTEAAMAYALDHGARDLVLIGWSMGGAIVLQTLDRSPLSAHVSLAILDSPVIDWGDVIAHHARLRRVPRSLAKLAQGLIGARWSRRLVGVHEPLDVARTNWQDRADELRHRVLLIHSADDEFVPVGPSRELARRRPDLVHYEEWQVARHVKEWNVDPRRWERVVAHALVELDTRDEAAAD